MAPFMMSSLSLKVSSSLSFSRVLMLSSGPPSARRSWNSLMARGVSSRALSASAFSRSKMPFSPATRNLIFDLFHPGGSRSQM